MAVITLTPDECRLLLPTTDIGRLAIVVKGYPEVFPVNYAFVRDRVIIRTDPGLKLRQAHFARVCFQVDELDLACRTGWTVLVRGTLHEVKEGDHLADEIELAARRMVPWGEGDKVHILLVTPVSLTGRRITAAPELSH